MKKYDVIVVGAGHAGIEASLAAARLNCRVCLVTFHKDNLGAMSCNPAIGGLGKGQLVKEIDALGGEMARAADNCGIQFRILNASKGEAVRSTRAQIDMRLYQDYMQKVFAKEDNIDIKETEVIKLLIEKNKVIGIATIKEEIYAKSVVVAAGTFLGGLIHVGLDHHSAGRIHEKPSIKLAQDLKRIGFTIQRFKTGTCARIDTHSINYQDLIEQKPDETGAKFSFFTSQRLLPQVSCFITYTNKKTHQVIRDNLKYSPLYSGLIKATGVRYCPSIEDKVVKFPDRERHQVFLEPQGLKTNWVYCNGISTSLPEHVQLELIHSITGLEQAKILRFGYGIEYDLVDPTELFPTLETKKISNLFLAGQINGTTGYEEAAALGLIAGINAASIAKHKDPFILDRSQGYIGVLIDDLVTKGTNEPYRMFTSRVEYRLILREDNADLRLSEMGYKIGLLPKKSFARVIKKQKETKNLLALIKKDNLKPTRETNSLLNQEGLSSINKDTALTQILKRPESNISLLKRLSSKFYDFNDEVLRQVQIQIKYSGFIERQLAEVDKFKHLEKIVISDKMSYPEVGGLSREIREKLDKFKPLNLGQASRISGITPTAIAILMVFLRKTYKR